MVATVTVVQPAAAVTGKAGVATKAPLSLMGVVPLEGVHEVQVNQAAPTDSAKERRWEASVYTDALEGFSHPNYFRMMVSSTTSQRRSGHILVFFWRFEIFVVQLEGSSTERRGSLHKAAHV